MNFLERKKLLVSSGAESHGGALVFREIGTRKRTKTGPIGPAIAFSVCEDFEILTNKKSERCVNASSARRRGDCGGQIHVDAQRGGLRHDVPDLTIKKPLLLRLLKKAARLEKTAS